MNPDIVIVTLNPAIDQTIFLDALTPGHVHRAKKVTLNAGGKGVNVASCLADWKAGSITLAGVIGDDNRSIFEGLCGEKHLDDLMIRIPGETRTNIKLVHDDETTDINLPGLPIPAEALSASLAIIKDCAKDNAILLLAGSLPPGVAPTIYAELIAQLRPTGARIVLDTSGAPLAAVLGGDAMPACIKPNRAELEEFCGHALPMQADLIGAAQSLRARGIELVVISLGADGALFVGEQTLHASLPAIRAASTVGAGDAMVAGIIASLAANAALESTARLATAFAAAKLGQAGPNLPARDIINSLAVQVKIKILEEAKP